MKTFYQSKFPHIHPEGNSFFVTLRLHDSIPKSKLKELERLYSNEISICEKMQDEHLKNLRIFNLRKKLFSEQDNLMDAIKSGPHYLKQESILNIVKEQIHRFDEKLYHLIAYSIMSNHVHLLIDTNLQFEEEKFLYDNNTQLSYIMKRIKGASARYSNQELERSGPFWEKESFDMFIRNEKMLNNVIGYILNNPVKAGIVNKWEDYSGNFLAT